MHHCCEFCNGRFLRNKSYRSLYALPDRELWTLQISVKTCGNFHKVFPETDEDIVATAEFFQLKQLGYYRKAIADYPIKAVVKGLPYECSTELIKQNLQELGYKVISDTKMNSKKEGGLLPFYNVELIRNPNVKEIFKLKRHCHLVISVESVRTTKKQCSVLTATCSIISPGSLTSQVYAVNVQETTEVMNAP